MQRTKRYGFNYNKKPYLVAFLWLVLFAMVFADCEAEAVSGSSGVTSRNFLWRGELDVSYERNSTENTSLNKIVQEYRLEVAGFVVDPRLMQFDITGSFQNEMDNPGDTYKTYSFQSTFSFLNTPILRGPLQYFPQPFDVRLAYVKSNSVSSYSYGLTLEYTLPRTAIGFFRAGKFISLQPWVPTRQQSAPENDNNSNDSSNDADVSKKEGPEKGLLVPFPLLRLDYDVFNSVNELSDAGDSETTRKYLSFRAETRTLTSQYLFQYQHQTTAASDQNITSKTRDQLFSFQSDHSFPDSNDNSLLLMFNSIAYATLNQASLLNVSSRGIWLKHFGANLRDTTSISGGAAYFKNDNSSGYGGNIQGSYSASYFDRLRNSITMTAAYDSITNKSDENFIQNGDGRKYSMALSDALTYELSRNIGFSGDLSANSEDGKMTAYGLSLGLNFRTNVAIVQSSYSYSHVNADSGQIIDTRGSLESRSGLVEESTDFHQIRLDIRSMLQGNIYLLSRNIYRVVDMQGGNKENNLNLNLDLYRNYERARFSIGASYFSDRQSGLYEAENTTTMIRASGAVNFGKNVFGSAALSYSTSNNGSSFFDFSPALSWSYRRFSVSANYDLRRRISGDGQTQLDQRIYVVFKRYFGGRINPFL